MNSLTPIISKRKFLKFFGYSSLLSAVPIAMLGCNKNQDSLEPIAHRMVSSLFHIEKSQEIGLLYLVDGPISEDHTYAELTEILLERLQLTQNMVTTENMHVLDEKIKAQVRQDFMNEDIVILRGWMLSRTELTLCALAAVLDGPQGNT